MMNMKNSSRLPAGTYVVKVQRPIFTSGDALCLVYNEDRSLTVQVPYKGKLVGMMGDDNKIYCDAVVSKDTLRFVKRVASQDW